MIKEDEYLDGLLGRKFDRVKIGGWCRWIEKLIDFPEYSPSILTVPEFEKRRGPPRPYDRIEPDKRLADEIDDLHASGDAGWRAPSAQ